MTSDGHECCSHDHSLDHADGTGGLGSHRGHDVVCVDDVSFAYDGRAALEHVTLHVSDGITLGVIGPNGSGKTTLLKIMLGLLTPQRGSVRVAGMSPQAACARGDVVGYLPQRHTIDWDFPISARRVVELGFTGTRGLLGRPTRWQKAHAMELLAAVQMAEHADGPIGELSGGQQQRVFLARALAAGPRILFLDEPMTGVDPAAQEGLMAMLRRIQADMHLTVVMVSHNLRSVIATCDKVACINRTLHYHDRPAAVPRETLLQLFQCDMDVMDAMLGGKGINH